MKQFTVGRRPSVKAMRRLFTCLSLLCLVLVSGVASAPAFAAGESAPENQSVAITCLRPYCSVLPLVMAPRYCTVGQTMTDPLYDVSPGHIDVVSMETAIEGSILYALIRLRDVPPQLTFNRYGVSRNNLEYGWEVHIDVDNNLSTGYPYYPFRGTEIMIAANHFVTTPDSPVNQPIENGVQVNTWVYDKSFGGWSFGTWGDILVDASSDFIFLAGNIPGLNPSSQVLFETYDDNPTGSTIIRDLGYCSTPNASASQGAQSPAEGELGEWMQLEDGILTRSGAPEPAAEP